MTNKVEKKSGQAFGGSKGVAPKRKLPPDPDGLFKRAAARGEKVIAFYLDLYPDAEGFELGNLLHDLMHFCDRNRKLDDFHEGHGFAISTYTDFVAENMWARDWYDDLETARSAAERMLLGEA